MQITGQSQNTEPIQSVKTDRLCLTFRLVASAANLAVTLPTFSNVSAKAILTREGQKYEIFNDNLQNLGVACQIKKGLEPMININFAQGRVGSPAAAGVTSQSLIPIVLHLGGVLDVCHSDVLSLEINVNSGTYSNGGNLNQTGCTLDTYWQPCDGHEDGVPTISCSYIQATVGTQTITPGDSITHIVVANYDKGLGSLSTFGTLQPTAGNNASDANQVITNCNFSSAHFSRALSADRMNMQQPSFYESWQEYIFRGQCYIFKDDHHNMMDNCVLSLTMNATNNTASNNVVTAFKRIHDANGLTRYQSSVQKKHVYHHEKVTAHLEKAGKAGTPTAKRLHM